MTFILLGVVRHNGFIPWDDDLDLMMPYEDILKLYLEINLRYKDKYKMVIPTLKNGSACAFVKIYDIKTELDQLFTPEGYKMVFIDIFPMYYLPKNKIKQLCHSKIGLFCSIIGTSVLMYKTRSKTTRQFMKETGYRAHIQYGIRIGIGFFMSFINYSIWFGIYNKIFSKVKKTDFFVIPSGRKGYKVEQYSTSLLDNRIKCNFENITVQIIKNYDIYLEKLYGDYMIIPDHDNRERHYFTSFKILD